MPISGSPCRPRRRSFRLSALAAGLLLGACASLQEPPPPVPVPMPSPAAPKAEHALARTPPRTASMLGLEDYLSYAKLLSAAQLPQQKRVYQQAVAAYRENPTPHRKLRYALTLEVLASPYSDPRRALHLFKELAAAEPPLPEDIRLLVDLQIHALQQRLELTDRVAILNKALQDADAKIDALTDIEQSLEPPASEPDTTRP